MSELSNLRLSICKECPYNENNECIICGCDLLIKTEKLEEQCPLTPPKWIKAESFEGVAGEQVIRPTPPPRTVCIPCNRR